MWCVRACACVCACVLWAAAATHAVSVLRLTVDFENEHTVDVDSSVEYILEFIPTAEQAQWPARLQLSAAGGELARPVLLTARQTNGAQTWQLPYQEAEGAEPLYRLQRTLCYSPGDASGAVTERFSLHVSAALNRSVSVRARADPQRDYRLQLEQDKTATVLLTAPVVSVYEWGAGEESVRVVVAAHDDVCAVVAIQNNTCPVAETASAVARAGGLQMTVQRSGGAQLARSQFPSGVYVVVVVLPTDEPCVGAGGGAMEGGGGGAGGAGSDWLFELAVGGARDVTTPTPAPADDAQRTKTITITMKPALSRAQYAVACAVTLAVFLSFYVAFAALVVAQRAPRVRRLVGPRAVLAHTHADGVNKTVEDATSGAASPVASAGAGAGAGGRTRRDSTATFDSCDDNSESDEEAPPAPPAAARTPRGGEGVAVVAVEGAGAGAGATRDQPDNGQPAVGSGGSEGAAPFGLPPRLQLSALSRRPARTLRARSDRYLHTLYTVAVFYALPVVQFVAAFQLILNVSGSLDLCYYNFLCAHPAGALSDFNHVFSNLGYLLLGALFIVQVRRRENRRKRSPRHPEYGIPAHYGLVSSLGAGMMVVALLSASYHVCPNQLNFQFDTAFMYVLAVLSVVKMYQARHPDINARAHATFGVLAVLIAFVVWGVLGGGALFWGLWTVLHVFSFLLLSLRIYYVGQFRLDGASVGEAARGVRALRGGGGPLYAPRLLALWVANAVNWTFAIYGLVAMSADFASHLLFVLLGNALLYMIFYLAMKLVHGERLRWYAWCYLAGAAGAWAPAMYFFVSGSSSWSATPAQSRHRNHECRVLQFYDSHDLWHMLSAVALYLSFNAMLTWDDGLSAVKRTDIAVF